MLLANSMHNVMRRRLHSEITITFKQCVFNFSTVTICLFTMVKDSHLFPQNVLWLTVIIYGLMGFATRMFWKHVVIRYRAARKKRSMLLVTDHECIGNVFEIIDKFELNHVDFVGIIYMDSEDDKNPYHGIPVVCSMEDAAKYICHEWIDEVFISTIVPPIDLINLCTEMGVTVHRELHTKGTSNEIVEKIAGAHVLTSSMNMASKSEMFVKRIVDIIGGLVGSIFALIVLAIVGPKIKKASPGPILFKQQRIGQNGKHFTMIKIRSMYLDAEERKAELMNDNRVAGGMMFKLDWDPRIIGNEILPDGTQKTGIGEMSRRTSRDEFPRFFCVLKGDMSLVGTRPPTIDEWDKYEWHHRARLATKPGLTGMWQVSGRSDITDFEEVVKLDTTYIDNWSYGLDIWILMKTVINVITRKGAL